MAHTKGLYLGKFAPLHKGHQYVIETALMEVDDLHIIIYDSPDHIHIPLKVRSHWLQKLYPQIKLIEAWNGPKEVGHTHEIQHKHENYILNDLKIKNITHFYSSEFYGHHMSLALNAINRLVDPERKQVPVSASLIRQNPYQYHKFIDPIVYRDLITNIVFLGAPCTGKTTLAKILAKKFNTRWMPEYGRDYWEQNQVNRRLTPEQLVEIARNHLQQEESLLKTANKYLFTDTNAITTAMFSLDYHKKIPEELIELADIAEKRYDLYFLCEDDIPYDNTWDRSGSTHREIFQKQITGDLLSRKIPFISLRGNLITRLKKVGDVLKKYYKYGSIGNLV